MFSQQQAVVRVSTLFSSVRLAPPPTHGLQIRPAGLSLLLLPKGKPSATLQQCSYGLVLELQLERAAVASIHWAAEKGVFSETRPLNATIIIRPVGQNPPFGRCDHREPSR